MMNKLAGTVKLILRVGAGAGFSPNISPDPPTLSMNVKSSPRNKKLKVKKEKCLPDGEKKSKNSASEDRCGDQKIFFSVGVWGYEAFIMEETERFRLHRMTPKSRSAG
jgi:hypothetical protein